MADMIFADKLSRLIADRGASQAALSRATGIAQPMISGMASGRQRPYGDQVFKLARELGVTADYLLDDAQDDPPPPDAGLAPDERAVLAFYRVRREIEGPGFTPEVLGKRCELGGYRPTTPPAIGVDLASPTKPAGNNAGSS